MADYLKLQQAAQRARKISEVLVDQGVDEIKAILTVREVLKYEMFGGDLDEAAILKAAKDSVKDCLKIRGDAAIKNMSRFKSLHDSMMGYPEKISETSARTFHLMGLLEDASRGIRGGEVATIVARSGAYKTCILENLLINQAKELERYELPGILLLFSFEMPEEGIAERAIQASARKTVDDVTSAAGDDAKWGELCGQIKNKEALKKIYCYYGEPLTVEEMAQLTLDMEFIQPVHGIAIDYVGYLKGKTSGSRYEKVSEIARDIKIGLARKINVPVVQLSQANRAEGRDGTEEITLSSARDSGAIEESSDFMYGFWKEENETGAPKLWGRILKERRHFETNGAMNPYFQVEFKPEFMLLQGINERQKSEVPSRQKDRNYGKDY